jgi:hypothetical protein
MVGVGVSIGVGVDRGVGVGSGVGVSIGVGVGRGVGVGIGVSVGVGCSVGSGVGVRVGRSVGRGVVNGSSCCLCAAVVFVGVGVEIGVAVGTREFTTDDDAVGTWVLLFVSFVFVLPLLGPMPVKRTATKTRKMRENVPVAILAFMLHARNRSLAGNSGGVCRRIVGGIVSSCQFSSP